jgi:hypothetical protein
VLTVGWLLGGTVGVGTVLYAFGIGPLVQLVLRFTPRGVLAEFGAESTARRPRTRRDRVTTMSECQQTPSPTPTPTC